MVVYMCQSQYIIMFSHGVICCFINYLVLLCLQRAFILVCNKILSTEASQGHTCTCTHCNPPHLSLKKNA